MDLPNPNERLTPKRKATIVRVLLDGLWTAQELCDRYSLTLEELEFWVNAYQRGGAQWLRVTKLQTNGVRQRIYVNA